MTVYCLEGIMVLVVVYALGVAFLVFYLKWRKATAELKRLRRSKAYHKGTRGESGKG